MSNVIGTLELQLMADVARIRQDMEAAKNAVGSATSEMQRYAGMAAKALGAIGVAVGLDQVRQMVAGFINAADSLDELSQQTGITVEMLSALEDAGRLSGTSAETIAGAVTKMARAMAGAKEEGAGVGQALRAIGLDFEEFRRLSPDQQLITLAQSLEKFEDGGGKAAVAMTLLGKEGAKLIPFLKDLVAQGDLNVKVTTEQAAAAAQFNDNVTLARKVIEDWQRSLALGLLPDLLRLHELLSGMVRLLGSYLVSSVDEAGESFDGLGLALKAVAVVMETLLITGANVAYVFKAAGREIGGIVAQFSSMGEAGGVFTAEGRAAWAAVGREIEADAERGRKQLEEFEQAVFAVGRRVTATREALRTNSVSPGENLREMDSLSGRFGTRSRQQVDYRVPEAPAKETVDAYTRLLESYQQLATAGRLRAEQQLAEAETGRKLTDAEQDYVKVMQAVADGKVKMLDLQRLGIQTRLQENMATAASAEAARQEAQWMAETAKANEDAIAARRSLTLELQAQVAQDRESLATMGMSTRQLAARQAALLRDAAAAKDRAAVEADLVDWTGKASEEIRRQAALLRERAALAEEGVAVKEAQAAAAEWQKVADTISQGLTDAIYRGFENGKGGVEAFLDAVKQMLKTTVLRLAIQPVQQGVNQFVSGLLGSGGQGGQGGVSSLMQAWQTLSSLYSTGSSLISTAGGWLGMSGAAAGSSGVANAALIEAASGTAGYGASSGALGGAASSAGGAAAGGATAFSTFWPLAAIAGFFRARADYEEGFGNAQAIRAQNQVFGGNFGQWSTEGALSNLLSSLGFNEEWSSLLSGSTAVAKIMGRAAPRVEGRNIIGTITGDGFTGSFDERIRERGGLLRSDRVYTNRSEVSADVVRVIDDMARQVRGSVSQYAQALGLPVQAIRDYAHAINVDVTFATPEEAASRVEAALRGYAEGLLGTFDSVLAGMRRAGETTEQTLQRLSAVQAFSADLNLLGGVFSRLATQSLTAREGLFALVGGMEALQQQAGDFVQNYYSRDEIAGVKARELQTELARVGITQDIGTREQFRALVESRSTTPEQLAVLLSAGNAFASLSDYLAETGSTLASTAARAPEMLQLGGLFQDGSTAQVAATNAVEVAVGRVEAAVVQLQTQLAGSTPAASLYDSGPAEVVGLRDDTYAGGTGA